MERPSGSSHREEAASPPSRPVRVLFVEDEPLIQRVFVRALQRHGFDVLSASTGPEAVALGREADPPVDVAVIDAGLPGLSGPEVYRTLLQSYSRLPVIFATGESVSAFPKSLVDNVDTLVLNKPFTVDHLVDAIEQVMTQDADGH